MSERIAPEGATRTRPRMKNYGLRETSEGLLAWDWAESRLIGARNYWIATASTESVPHVAPVWGVWIANRFYFGSDTASRKWRNMSVNPLVTMHLDSGDEVVIVEGIAALHAPDAVPPQIRTLYGEKYPPFTPDETQEYWVIDPTVILAWVEADFPTTATRWVFADTD